MIPSKPTLSRTLPILVCAAVFAARAHADCKALDGVYASESDKKGEGARTLTEFAPSRERGKLFKTERPAGPAQGFDSSGLRTRPKFTPLASTVRLHYTGGRLALTFMDAGGKALAEGPIDSSPAPWKCSGDRLERSYQTTGGLGDRMYTRRTKEELFVEGGNLHFVELTKTVEKPAEEKRSEATFKRQASAPAR